jgi:hypothetical protein
MEKHKKELEHILKSVFEVSNPEMLEVANLNKSNH